MKLNWFVLAVAILQFGGAGMYVYNNRPLLGLLYFLYGLTNVVILYL